jgi:hypothetical protein
LALQAITKRGPIGGVAGGHDVLGHFLIGVLSGIFDLGNRARAPRRRGKKSQQGRAEGGRRR